MTRTQRGRSSWEMCLEVFRAERQRDVAMHLLGGFVEVIVGVIRRPVFACAVCDIDTGGRGSTVCGEGVGKRAEM